MKKIITILSVALVLAACQKSGLQTSHESIPAPDELYGAIAGQNVDGTKAYFVGPVISGSKVNYPHFWETGDDISVFWENTQNRLYRCYNDISNTNTVGMEEEDVKYSKFGKLESLALGDASSIGNVRYCIHPFDYRNKVIGENVTFWIPDVQTYRAEKRTYSTAVDAVSYGTGEFKYNKDTSYSSNGCAVFVAKNTEPITGHYNYFNFYNVGCWLKLIIKSNEEFTLGRIELTGNNGQVLAGSASTSFEKTYKEDGTHHILDDYTEIKPAATGGATKVTLKGNVGVKDVITPKTIKSTASEFYIYLLPTTFFKDISPANQGFTLKIFDKDDNLKGTAVAKSKDNEGDIGEAEVFKRNRVVRMSDWELTELKFAVLTVREWTNVEETINFE